MARAPRNLEARDTQPAEHVEVLAAGEPQDGDLPDYGHEPQVVADATARNPRPPAKPAQARYYRVERSGFCTLPGSARTQLREGKVIDDLNYPIESLRQQGIRLAEVSEADRFA